MRAWRAIACALVSSVALGAAGSATIQVTDAWIRWLPGSLPSGGYLTVTNAGDHAVSLIAASCADYGSVSLHRSRQQGGVASMIPVNALTIPAHSTLAFEAQGYHLMLEQAKQPIKPGDRITITLQFASGPAIPVQFEVRAPAPA
jgi:copper(I)-binding protein